MPLTEAGGSGQPTLSLVVITLISAMLMQMLSVHRDFDGTKAFLRKALPAASETTIFRLDFLLVVAIGTFIGTIFFAPETPVQALSAGFGWVSVINVISKPKAP